MASFNKVIIMGNLTRDPELRFLPSGKGLCKLGVAVNEKYKKDDEWVDRVDFVDVAVWGNQAENCAEYLKKGSSVLVEGKLRTSSWETEEGQKRSKMEVVAQSVQFLDQKKKEEPRRDIPF